MAQVIRASCKTGFRVAGQWSDKDGLGAGGGPDALFFLCCSSTQCLEPPTLTWVALYASWVRTETRAHSSCLCPAALWRDFWAGDWRGRAFGLHTPRFPNADFPVQKRTAFSCILCSLQFLTSLPDSNIYFLFVVS